EDSGPKSACPPPLGWGILTGWPSGGIRVVLQDKAPRPVGCLDHQEWVGVILRLAAPVGGDPCFHDSPCGDGRPRRALRALHADPSLGLLQAHPRSNNLAAYSLLLLRQQHVFRPRELLHVLLQPPPLHPRRPPLWRRRVDVHLLNGDA